MAKGPDGDAGGIMPAAELKPLLVLAKHQAVSCAIGMTRDKQGVILLHRRTRPKKLLAELKAEPGADLDRSSLRFGRVTVDISSGATTVCFVVNKAPPSALRLKLLERLRLAGYQKTEITVDGTLETEEGEETAETAGAAGQQGAGSPPPPGQAPDQPASPPAAGVPTPTLSPTAASPAASPPPASQPSASAQGKPQYPPSSPLFAKGSAAWSAVHAKLHADVDAALKAMADVYGGDEPRAKAIHGRVGTLMAQLDEGLSAKLGEIAGNAAPETHGSLVGEAQAMIERHRALLASNELVDALDRNPFRPVAMRGTLDAALTVLAKVVKTTGGNAPETRSA